MTQDIYNKPILYTKDISEVLNLTANTIQSTRWKENSGCPIKKRGKYLAAEAKDFWKWYRGN